MTIANFFQLLYNFVIKRELTLKTLFYYIEFNTQTLTFLFFFFF